MGRDVVSTLLVVGMPRWDRVGEGPDLTRQPIGYWLNFINNNRRVVMPYRDAETGEYVTEEYAKRHPKTTVHERDKPKPKPPSKPKKR